jgi:hypothetical protein
MVDDDLSQLIAAKSEDLAIEYKNWMDPADKPTKAKLAKHLAALHNHGGGSLIFGVDDSTKEPLGPCPFPDQVKVYGEDAISAIVKRYLEPHFQCRVVWTEHDGERYPVIIVPPHGAMPAIVIADGPNDAKGNPIGVKHGQLFIRVPGPASEPIRSFKDWTELLDRCLQHHTDKLASLARQAIGIPRYVGPDVKALLKEATDKTIADYLAQIANVLPTDGERREHRLGKVHTAYAAVGYALVDFDGAPVPLVDLRARNETVARSSRLFTTYPHFLPLTTPDLAPQIRPDTIAGRETNYLEGARLENARTLAGEVDVWRLYDLGVACCVSSFREDYVGAAITSPVPFDGWMMLLKLHRTLVHARFTAQGLDAVANVVVRLDWRGIAGRTLSLSTEGGTISVYRPAGDSFVHTVTIPWALLRDNYPAALTTLARPLFAVFNLADDFYRLVLDPNEIAKGFAELSAKLVPPGA